ncbi:MAG: hypothetical protein ACOCP8_05230 [archaeon]
MVKVVVTIDIKKLSKKDKWEIAKYEVIKGLGDPSLNGNYMGHLTNHEIGKLTNKINRKMNEMFSFLF